LLHARSCGVLRVDLSARPHLDNAIALNRDRAIFDHAALGILGDDVARAPDEVDIVYGSPLLRREFATDEQNRDRDT